MRWFIWVVVFVIISPPLRSGAAPALDPQGSPEEIEALTTGWGRVTVPGGTWFLALRMGYRDPGAINDGSHLAAEVDFGVGLTDRIELRPTWLAVRLGSPGTAEVLLQAGTRGFAITGGSLLLTPTLGAQGILPVGRGHRFVLGVEASTFATEAEKLAFHTGKWLGDVVGGGSFRVGERLLVTAGVGVGQDWGRDFDVLRPINRSRATFVELGSVVAHGGIPLPLITYRIADWVSLDGSASMRLDEGLAPRTRVLGGFSLWF